MHGLLSDLWVGSRIGYQVFVSFFLFFFDLMSSLPAFAVSAMCILSEPAAADRRGIGKIQTLFLILSRQKIF